MCCGLRQEERRADVWPRWGSQAVRSGAYRGHKCGAELVKGSKTNETPPKRGSGLARS